MTHRLDHTNTGGHRASIEREYERNQPRRAKDVATPRSRQSALLGAPTATTVSTPPVGVHGRREAAAAGGPRRGHRCPEHIFPEFPLEIRYSV